MPIYEFKCDPCGTMFEELFTAGSDNGHVECPECGSDDIAKLMSVSAPQTSNGAGPMPSMPSMPMGGGACCGGGACGMN